MHTQVADQATVRQQQSRDPFGLRRRTARVGHARVDCLSFSDAVKRICELASTDQLCQLVVTPNIQHVVELERNSDFRQAYHAASLSLPDGWPVAVAAAWPLGWRQPRLAGADLMPAVCRAARDQGLTVGFMGGQPGAAKATAANLQALYPGLRVVFVHEAPVGFDDLPEVRQAILGEVAATRPNVLFLGLGAPRQELFAHRYRPAANVVMGVGAALDFCAGLRPRAPVVVQRSGLEWLFRIGVEPRRMWKRYANAAPAFVRVVLRDAGDRRSSPSTPLIDLRDGAEHLIDLRDGAEHGDQASQPAAVASTGI